MAAPVIALNGRWGGRLRNQDLITVSGDDLTLQVTVFNIDQTKKDLTGGSGTWNLTPEPGSADVKVTKTITLSDPTNGVFTVAVDGTGNLFGDYYHEAQFTESGGDIGTVMRGWMRIDKDSV